MQSGSNHFSRQWSSGVLDVQESKADQVAGVLYSIPHDEIQNLDLQKDGYQRSSFAVYTVDDEGVVNSENPTDADLYEGPGSQRNIPPTTAYVKTLVEGARHWGLPDDYIDKIRGLAESLMPKKSQSLD